MKKALPAVKMLSLIAVGVVFMYFAFRKEDMGKLFRTIGNADFKWILLSMVFGVLAHLSRAMRWNLLFEPLGHRAKTLNGFFAVMIGYLVNYTIPRSGEVARCAVLARTDNIPVNKLMGTVFIERIFDLILMMLIVVLTFAVQFDLLEDFFNTKIAPGLSSAEERAGMLLWFGVSAISLVLVFFMIRKKVAKSAVYQKISKILHGFIDGVKSIVHLKRPFLFIFHTIFIWFMYYMMGYVIFFSLDSTSSLSLAAGLTTLVMASIGVIIPIPGGVGVLGTISAGLLIYGIPDSDAKAYASLSYAAQTIMIFVVGGISWLAVMIQERKKGVRGSIFKTDESQGTVSE